MQQNRISLLLAPIAKCQLKVPHVRDLRFSDNGRFIETQRAVPYILV